MKQAKRGKNGGSAGTSPAKDAQVNRAGAITPAKATTANAAQSSGIFAFKPAPAGRNNDISNAGFGLFNDESKKEEPVKVNIKDVIDEAASKAQIYRALTIYGKFIWLI